MEGLTLTVAAITSVLVFFYGLIVYIAAIAWYPTYLTVPVGTVDFIVWSAYDDLLYDSCILWCYASFAARQIIRPSIERDKYFMDRSSASYHLIRGNGGEYTT